MIKYNTPQELFTAICDKIRDKIGSNELINHQDIPDKIDNLVDSDIINEYNELLSILNQDTIIELNNNEIENINICFRERTSLTTVNLPKCTSIGNSAFYHCTSLTTVNLPKCTSIESGTFYSCTRLTTVNLPECTSIGDFAFHECTSLTTIDLPKCTSIGDYAFQICNNLTTIIFGADQVVHIGDGAFNNYSIANGRGYIYVPDNLVDSYKSDTNWSAFANQIKPISELSN